MELFSRHTNRFTAQGVVVLVLLLAGSLAAQSPAGDPVIKAVVQPPVPPTDGEQLPPDAVDPLDRLLELSPQELSVQQAPALQQEVSIVTGQQSTVGKSPAAVFVVTQEMIRRSGAKAFRKSCERFPACKWPE